MAFSFINNGLSLSTSNIEANLSVNQLQQSGNIVYEYNPLKVLRINSDKTINSVAYPNGSLVGLDTEDLDFDLNHPVDIVTQQSYDGSVNLIMNDGSSNPKLINTRFSTTGMNTYQIVDRDGDNDTNIYDENTFNSDISLYKKTNTIPKLVFNGLLTDGFMQVGNYVFYFKLADSDGNETDFIAESGVVSCYKGNINDPFSEEGGLADMISYKSISFTLSNIDSSYNNIIVYYTRSSSDTDGNFYTNAFKLDKKFPVYNKTAKILITGYERTSEKISIDDINLMYNVVDNAKCQATNQNILFMGNVCNSELQYRELSDLALRFTPQLNLENSIGYVDENYKDSSGGYEYYNASNIYYKLGYWNDEIYRFGVVFILNDYTLSPVFNVRGVKNLYNEVKDSNGNITQEATMFDYYPVYSDEAKTVRNYIQTDKETYTIRNNDENNISNTNENSKGVVHINCSGINRLDRSGIIPIGINFRIQTDAVTELKKYVKGFFFVRQKRRPTTMCQAVTIGLESTGCFPVVPIGINDNKPTYLVERFIDNDRILTHNFERRIETINSEYVLSGYAAISPEFEQKQAYFNQFFTGTDFVIKYNEHKFSNKYFTRSGNYLYNLNYTIRTENKEDTFKVMSIPDYVTTLIGNKQKFREKLGLAEEGYLVEYYKSSTKTDKANNIVRGIVGPYLGLEGSTANSMELIDIKIPGYNENNMDEYFLMRYEDASQFRAISDRISIDDVETVISNSDKLYHKDSSGNIIYDNTSKISGIFRGDCFIGNYTHRMLRNFQDPTSPTNDEIIDTSTWKDNFKAYNKTSSLKINRGDVNAVKLGHWITVKVFSNINISLRSLDTSYPSEAGMTGKVRGFYPLQAMSTNGESKIPESFVINSGLGNTLSDRYYSELPNVPAIKDKFHTRIMYSDVNVNDAFKNGYRVFRGLRYRDYPTTYGAITKLISWYGYLICVFEHGVSLIPVNERALLSGADGGNIYINSSNVLPDNPKMLSDKFGSQWSESVVKTENYVYGVDTVGKKIWRTNGTTFELISDFKVQKFLNDNISLSEKEVTPIIGIRNVKTHYNAFKKDLLFTFYDDINVLEENVWNLCYNELLGCFVTFYSWVPSYSENIDNIFFTFDRNTSKSITKLSNTYPMFTIYGDNIESTGNLIKDISWTSDTDGYVLIGNLKLNLSNIALKDFNITDSYLDTVDTTFSIADNKVRNLYKIKQVGENWVLYIKENQKDLGPWTIPIKVELNYKSTVNNESGTVTDLPTYKGNLVLANSTYINNLTTSFWKHGKAGLMFTNAPIKPCYWYNEQHPFEFEFVVLNNQSIQKIYNYLQILSNNVKPESLHFEISGDSYKFTDEKKNAYFRQEATKHLYQFNGANITYNTDYLNINPEQRDFAGIPGPTSSIDVKRETIQFPLYYSRVNTLNNIYDHYQSMTSSDNDYQWLSGTEVTHDSLLDEYHLVTHIKACPFDELYSQEISKNVYDTYLGLGYTNIYSKVEDNITKYYYYDTYGRINGNMNYQEDKWDIQIPSIHYWAKNEKKWNIYTTEVLQSEYTKYVNAPYNYTNYYTETSGNTIKYYRTNKIVPLNLANNPLPEDMNTLVLFANKNNDEIPDELQKLGYTYDNFVKSSNEYNPIFDTTKWYGNDNEYSNENDSSFETKIRDKYLKVKIRYTGDRLAVITSINTIFTISYA